ncbi:GNAT family N-acetyltransferase [Aliiroseovarius sp. S2029]|uniref:GNAT family N-acetyltransferase n=1 Tax=Aliiroseovarius sp. S2029 TaxID=2936988 RepID=UPI0020BDFA46|nr:GNAT family N-acetyltransferase [Aliiroseovarius sp. S2029]MCK8484184.1 GNAT family N-acetyltransferase [Aliiroseovarius sp. S2029]
MADKFVIRAGRLTLRPLGAADGEQVVGLLNDYQVSRWLTVVPHPYRLSDFNGFLTHLADTSPLGGLAIEEYGQVMGVIGLDPTLGFWLGRVHQGRGIMTKAATALVDWAFENLEIDRMGSGYFRGNAASRAVLTKLGFRETGVIERVSCVAQGNDMELIKLSLTRDDWQRSQ